MDLQNIYSTSSSPFIISAAVVGHTSSSTDLQYIYSTTFDPNMISALLQIYNTTFDPNMISALVHAVPSLCVSKGL